METDLLSTEKVGAILKGSKVTMQQWCHDGKIPAAKSCSPVPDQSLAPLVKPGAGGQDRPDSGIGKAYRIEKSLDRWYEGKLLERTVFR
jgi:hypothetical protein